MMNTGPNTYGGGDGGGGLANTTSGMETFQNRVVDDHGIRVRDVLFMFLRRFLDPDSTAQRLIPGSPEAERFHEELMFYIPQLHRMRIDPEWRTLVVRWQHFIAFDGQAAAAVEASFLRSLPFLGEGLAQFLTQSQGIDDGLGGDGTAFIDPAMIRAPCVTFSFVPNHCSVRTLRSAMVGTLCSVSGTVTRTSQVRPELLFGVFKCNDCGTDSEPVEQQFRFTEPAACRNPECQNRTYWTLDTNHRDTKFGDWQKLRLQENANEIPVGCMPRTIEVIARDDAVEVAKPGDRVRLTGCAIVVPEVLKLFNSLNRREVERSMTGAQRGATEDGVNNLEGASGLKSLGVRDLNYRMCFLASTIAEADGDERRMLNANKGSAGADDMMIESGVGGPLSDAELDLVMDMRRRSPNILADLSKCVAPNIFQHELVKHGILLQIVGGISKATIEKINLRGDINVCIIGDPSTAKSQFLKWTATNVPRGIYTSGKASTASGLTATLTRDADTGERTIEAGALMLADHGVCCIDEFDKMDIKDQVAIHEAMEQQTISIAKAGIKATLNAKTSLLAALNPIGGKYDRRRPLQKNIALSAPIMSRFDLMFCIVDDADERTDFATATRILQLHRRGDRAVAPPFSVEDFQLYIRHVRQLKPVLSEDAVGVLANAYHELRMKDSIANRSKVYRVTTRLLESMIRLAEATAKIYMSERVELTHAQIALQLMNASLTTVDMTQVELMVDGGGDEEEPAETAMNEETSYNNDTAADGHENDSAMPSQMIGGGIQNTDAGLTAEEKRRRKKEAKKREKEAKRGGAGKKKKGGDDDTREVGGDKENQQPTGSSSSTSTKQQGGGRGGGGNNNNNKRITIPAEVYHRTVNRLILRLHELGDGHPTRRELVEWYLSQCPSRDVSQLELELRTTQLILSKQIAEGQILELRQDFDDNDDDVRLFLHPDCVPDPGMR